MASVTLEHITKVYPGRKGETPAVQEVSLQIRDAEFVVLVGPSGCGKSTTLRIIAGLEDVTDGVVKIGERVVNHVAPKDRDIAMVFQNYALYPHMTVYHNMAFGLRMRRVPRAQIKEKVAVAAAMLGIEHLLTRKPAALSGGERQRVAVGRAIVRNPQAFLFDEPLSNLDARLRLHMRTEIKKLHRQLATTSIYVTHDQEEAMTLGDRIAVMYKGRVQQYDTPLGVYHRPVNRFVAGFVGMPPMNFLDGQIGLRDGRPVFRTAGRMLPLPADQAGALAKWDGKSAVLGVRPEGLVLSAGGNGGGRCGRCGAALFGKFCHQCGAPAGAGSAEGDVRLSSIAATVEVVEPVGEEQDVTMRTEDGGRLVARVPTGDSVSAGATVQVMIDPGRAHLFEPGETGGRVN